MPNEDSGIRIALYMGTSLVSKLIRFTNWSKYSHASIIFPDGREVEAWHIKNKKTGKNGVQVLDYVGENHKPGTLVDIFNPHIPIEKLNEAWEIIKAQEGKPYDFRGVYNFLGRRDETEQDQQLRWFCAEIDSYFCRKLGYPLFKRIKDYKVYPGLIAYSLRLDFEKRIRILGNAKYDTIDYIPDII